MCKTNMKTNFYYADIYKHEHKKNMTRLWCKIVMRYFGWDETQPNTWFWVHSFFFSHTLTFND